MNDYLLKGDIADYFPKPWVRKFHRYYVCRLTHRIFLTQEEADEDARKFIEDVKAKLISK